MVAKLFAAYQWYHRIGLFFGAGRKEERCMNDDEEAFELKADPNVFRNFVAFDGNQISVVNAVVIMHVLGEVIGHWEFD